MRTVLALATLFFATLSQSALAQTTILVSNWVPTNHHAFRLISDWCGEIDKVTANRVKCKVLPKAVSSPAKSADAVRDGLADVSSVLDGYVPSPPVMNAITGIPFPPVETTGEAASVALQRIYDKYFAKFNEHKGLKVLAVWCGSPSNLYTSGKAINSPKDIQGLKIQANNPDAVAFLRGIGAVPVAKPISESYEMLSSGITDGLLSPIESVKSFRLDKFVKSVHSTPILFASISLFINEGTWQKISPDDRAAIEKLSGERLARTAGKEFDKADASAVAVLKLAGIERTPLPEAVIQDWKVKGKAQEAAWIAAAKAKGLSNPEQVLSEFRTEILKVAREH